MGQIHQMSISSKAKFMINRWIWDYPLMGTKSQAISDQIQRFIQQSIGLSRLIGIKSIQNNAVPTPATIGSPKFGIRVCVHRYQVAEWPRTGDQPSLPWDYTSMNIICVSWSLNRFHMNLPYIYINIYQIFWRWNAKIQPAVKQKSTSMASAGEDSDARLWHDGHGLVLDLRLRGGLRRLGQRREAQVGDWRCWKNDVFWGKLGMWWYFIFYFILYYCIYIYIYILYIYCYDLLSLWSLFSNISHCSYYSHFSHCSRYSHSHDGYQFYCIFFCCSEYSAEILRFMIDVMGNRTIGAF